MYGYGFTGGEFTGLTKDPDIYAAVMIYYLLSHYLPVPGHVELGSLLVPLEGFISLMSG